MKNKCKNMYCDGHDVKCSLTGLTLGDIMGYDDKVCTICQQTFLRELIIKLAKTVVENRPKNTKEVLNYMYGKAMCKDNMTLDCDFCRNADTCGDLDHDNDLGYISCGTCYSNEVRMFFRSGDKRKTVLLIEYKYKGCWKPLAQFEPAYCPFCGRNLFENKMYRR